MKKLFLLLLILFLGAYSAAASYISLQTSVTSRVVKNTLKVSVSAINKGDEPAHNVQAEIRVKEKTIPAKKLAQLGVNQVYRAQASFNLSHKKPGEYPLIVTMHYADANLYPFSALTSQTFSYKTDALVSEIFGSMQSTTFWKKGKVKLTLKNMSRSEVKASTYLVVPRELTVAEKPFELSIPSKSARDLNFEIENFSALHGSSYQVFAISEYEKNGVYQTSISPGTVKIIKTREIFGINYTVIIVVLLLMVLIFVAAQFLKKK
ncbi:MAG: hypothetical protein V3T21_01860 [Candidatus Margulisiibacteriota bacterium]